MINNSDRLTKISSANDWHATPVAEFTDLAQHYNTPFFLYDADAIIRRINLVRESFEHLVGIFYAMKANPNLALLRALRTVADGLDISSGGELEQASVAGFDMSNVSFAGPAKSTSELTAAIRLCVGYISIESLREVAECVDISRQLGVKAKVAVRVNPQFLNRAFAIKMGGIPVQFGVDEEALNPVLEYIAANPGSLVFRGIHVYAGSQCFDPAGIVKGAQNCFRIVSHIEACTGLTCETINLGGGFGIAHTENDRELELKFLAKELVPILHDFCDRSGTKRHVIFELGRFLTADAGIYVTRVISSKESRGKTFFIVDGGLHHHLAAAGSFGAMLRGNFVLRNLSRPEAPKVRCSIAGSSCNPTDLLGVDVELPRPEHGDLIAVLRSGSYGLTASPLLFLGRPTPAELICHQGEIILGRRPRTIIDFN
jgi:diaminopimelate decarboxylase